MRRFAKIAITIFQVCLAIIAYNLPRFFPHSRWLYPNAAFVKDLIGKLNFPLETIWSVIFLSVDRLTKHLPTLPSSLFNIAVVVVAALVVLSVAGFWWLVVSEVELRSRGRSLLRSRKPFAQIAISLVLGLFGVWAIVGAYRSLASLNSGSLNYYLLLRGLILVVWAAIFLSIAVTDFIALLRDSSQRMIANI